MSVLIYAETYKGALKKSSLELASYGKALAKKMNTSLIAVSIHAENTSELGTYGVEKIWNAKSAKLESFNVQLYAEAIAEIAENQSSEVILLNSSANSKYIAPILAVKAGAAYASNVVELPEELSPFRLKQTAFSNKAFVLSEIESERKLLSLSQNSFGIFENPVNISVEDFSPNLSESTLKIKSVEKNKGPISIADADIIVSGGRGLKGPENWAIVEELAEVLGAATACSKPVSDLGWRPHSEHVGQTGKSIAPNMYIAIGISGAVQHLAGVNASKIKVVINSDPEAPFFKAADYGIVGDAFEVVPKLIKELKKFKDENI